MNMPEPPDPPDPLDPRQMLAPYAHAAPNAEKPGKEDHILFVSEEGVRHWANATGTSLRVAMISLLEKEIWPERFRRNDGVFSSMAMARLLSCRAFVLGCGGLGGHVTALLARMGVGCLRLCDHDTFTESNLNRQYFCTERTLGLNKALATRCGVLDIASYMDVEAITRPATLESLPDMVAGMDVVLDCLDHIPMKKSLEQAALAAGVPFVHGSVLRDEGFASLNTSSSPLLDRLYPQNLSLAELEAGRREGVIATAPAGVACLMVSLAAQYLTSDNAAKGVAGQGKDGDLVLHHLDFSVPDMSCFMV